MASTQDAAVSAAKHTPGPWEARADVAYSGQRYWRLVRLNPARTGWAMGQETLLTPKGYARRFLSQEKAEAEAARRNAAIAKATGSDEPANPYPSGSMREGWQRGYEGRPMLAAEGSDYAHAYGEGKRAAAIAKATGSQQ